MQVFGVRFQCTNLPLPISSLQVEKISNLNDTSTDEGEILMYLQ